MSVVAKVLRRPAELAGVTGQAVLAKFHLYDNRVYQGQFSCALCSRLRTMSLALPDDLELPGFIVGEEKFVFLICLIGGLMVIFD